MAEKECWSNNNCFTRQGLTQGSVTKTYIYFCDVLWPLPIFLHVSYEQASHFILLIQVSAMWLSLKTLQTFFAISFTHTVVQKMGLKLSFISLLLAILHKEPFGSPVLAVSSLCHLTLPKRIFLPIVWLFLSKRKDLKRNTSFIGLYYSWPNWSASVESFGTIENREKRTGIFKSFIIHLCVTHSIEVLNVSLNLKWWWFQTKEGGLTEKLSNIVCPPFWSSLAMYNHWKDIIVDCQTVSPQMFLVLFQLLRSENKFRNSLCVDSVSKVVVCFILFHFVSLCSFSPWHQSLIFFSNTCKLNRKKTKNIVFCLFANLMKKAYFTETLRITMVEGFVQQQHSQFQFLNTISQPEHCD